jgi:endonuclease/exonuclease/phosphatase (EEP) superfamily protein YafD
MNKFLSRVLFGLFLSVQVHAQTITVSSWNIRGGGKWPEVQQEFSKALASTSEIITLQEVHSDQAETLAQFAGMNFYYSGSNAILTKLEIRNSGIVYSASTNRTNPWIEVEWRGEPLLIYGPHLAYKVKTWPWISGIRLQEMQDHLAHANGRRAIIAGDLNTVEGALWNSPEPSVKTCFQNGFVDALTSNNGFTHVLGRLDWILARGFHVLKSTRGNFSGSDHRWIRATLD